MIEPDHPRLSIVRQCGLVSISRIVVLLRAGASRRGKVGADAGDRRGVPRDAVVRQPQMTRHLRRLGHVLGRKRVRRLMRLMGLAPIYQKPRTSDPHPHHRIYPYLLAAAELGDAILKPIELPRLLEKISRLLNRGPLPPT